MSSMIAPAVLEEIRQRNDIVAVIGSYFQLQRSGATFKALCPFHREKTPSFVVNPQRQIYHCFGCGAGGDVFRFIMEYDKVDFMAAVRLLAQRAGVRLAFSQEARAQASQKNMLYEINAQVAQLYHRYLLQDAAGQPARDYLQSRDLPMSVVERFQLGLAPDRWDTVLRWAQKKYQREQLQAAGLVLVGESARWYDRFRNRLMLPVHDEQGRVVGFSGRLLAASAEQGAKYVNTPETALFHKGRLLYALHKARRAIVEAHEAILCEGQIDVIRCHLAGFTTAVAAQGTAFTEDHARMLKRYADSVVLVFDADRAGQDAALRAADVFLQVGLAVRIAALPAGTDPDSLLQRSDGPAQFQQLIQHARTALDFQIDVLGAREAEQGEAGLLRVATAVLAMIQRTPNAIQQAHLLQRAAARLGLPEEALRQEWQKQARRLRPPASSTARPSEPRARRPAKELALVEHLAADASLAGLVQKYLPLELLVDDQCRQLLEACLEAAQGRRNLLDIVAERDNVARDLAHFAAQVLAAPAKVAGQMSTNEESVQSLILGIRTDSLRRRRKEIESIRQAAQAGRGPRLSAAEDKQLELEHCHLGYDLVKLQNWDSALPLMEL